MRRDKPIPDNARAFIIQEVIRNAEMIWKRIDEHHIDEGSYARSTEYQDLLTMPMLRICELVSEYRSVSKKLTNRIHGQMLQRCTARLRIPMADSTLASCGMPSPWISPSSLMFAGRGFRNSEVACSKTLHV